MIFSKKVQYGTHDTESVPFLKTETEYIIKKIHLNSYKKDTGKLDKPHNAIISIKVGDKTILSDVISDLFSDTNTLIINEHMKGGDTIYVGVRGISSSSVSENDYLSATFVLEQKK